jgi:hypothetical protein
MKLARFQKLASITTAVVIGALPLAANAAERLWVCRDDNGKITYLTIDLAERHVTLLSGRSPGRCKIELRDGVSAYPYGAPPGEYCIYEMLTDHEAARQFVRSDGRTVTFGITGSQGTSTYRFDPETGILDSGEDTEECHRPHG